MMRSALAAAFAVLAGCNRIFDLDHVDPPPPDAVIDAVDAPPPFTCPSNYRAKGDSFYREPTTSMSRAEARADCIADTDGFSGHTHLAVLGTQAEIDLVANPEHHLWIGLDDVALEGDFVWVTAEPLAGWPPADGAPWGDGEPNNTTSTGEDCVKLHREGVLFDSSCSETNGYVCECDAFEDTSQ